MNINQNLKPDPIRLRPLPEEQTSEVEDLKLTNSSSDETEFDPERSSPSPSPSERAANFREVDGILTGGGAGTIGKRNFSKSKEPNSDFSTISLLRADSASENPFFLRKSSTASTSETAMDEQAQNWREIDGGGVREMTQNGNSEDLD